MVLHTHTYAMLIATMRWQRLDNYPLGEGGYGKVYLARYKVKPDDSRYKFMAVKKFDKARLDPAHVRSFEDEVASLCRLRHPNIVRYLGESAYFRLENEINAVSLSSLKAPAQAPQGTGSFSSSMSRVDLLLS